MSILRSTFSLLNTDYVQLGKNWDYKNVTSTFYRLYYIDGGEGSLYNTDSSIKLEAGFIYLVPSFTNCNYYCDDHLSQYYISAMEASADGASLFASNRKIFKVKATDNTLNCFKRILQLNPNRNLHISYNPKVYEKYLVLKTYEDLNHQLHAAAYIETCGLLLQLIAQFMVPGVFLMNDKGAIHSKISDAINYIQTNLQQNITVAKLAKRANHNADYFSRLFFENTGERPLAYIQSKRIERAQLLLSTTNLSFYNIAAETGFDTLSYFSRIFKNVTGQTPGSYKKTA